MRRPSLQFARAGLDVATVDGRILAIGGFDEEVVFKSVEARSVSGPGPWRSVADLPTARSNAAAATVGGFVYAVGGFTDEEVLAAVDKYDPKTNRWTPARSLPRPRGAAGAAGLDGLLYVAGGDLGFEVSEITNSLIVYNPRLNTWSSLAPMSISRMRLRLVASGHYLYAIGGQADYDQPSLAAVERYDPRSNSWTVLRSMHETRVLPGAVETRVGDRTVIAVVAGVEFVDGGVFGPTGRRTTEVFDIQTGKWILLNALLPFIRGSLGSAIESDGTVLAIAGGTIRNGVIEYVADVNALTITTQDLREGST
jgi:kelch-like protein 2/3